jgi:hypothetical protein
VKSLQSIIGERERESFDGREGERISVLGKTRETWMATTGGREVLRGRLGFLYMGVRRLFPEMDHVRICL